MAAIIIPTGPYFGFTLAELTVELSRYKLARQQAGTRLAGGTVNGQTFTFGDRKDGSLDEWQANLQAALSYLDPDTYYFPVPSDRAAARPARQNNWSTPNGPLSCPR